MGGPCSPSSCESRVSSLEVSIFQGMLVCCMSVSTHNQRDRFLIELGISRITRILIVAKNI